MPLTVLLRLRQRLRCTFRPSVGSAATAIASGASKFAFLLCATGRTNACCPVSAAVAAQRPKAVTSLFVVRRRLALLADEDHEPFHILVGPVKRLVPAAHAFEKRLASFVASDSLAIGLYLEPSVHHVDVNGHRMLVQRRPPSLPAQERR